MKKKDKQKRRDFLNARYGQSHGYGKLGVGVLEYLLEDDYSIPRLRTKHEKKNLKVARKNVRRNK